MSEEKKSTPVPLILFFALWPLGLLLFIASALAAESPKERLAKAEAIFQERCKMAGEKIYKTVENVEGVFLIKVRPEGINYGDQFRMDDPYGRDLGGDGYIGTFVRGSYQANTTGVPAPGSPPRLGYLYVEVTGPDDGKRIRYTGRIDEPWKYDNSYSKTYRRFVLDKVPATGAAPRYGVTYDDISTREDREYWIAGSSLRVIDVGTKEILAERIGYMMDRGQGNKSGGRSPWLLAANDACPPFHRNPNTPLPRGRASSAQPHQAQDFVEKVLKPKLGK